MTVKEYNEVWYPLINNSAVFLVALEHNIKKAESPEEALANLGYLGWSPELKKFLNDAVGVYRKELLSQLKKSCPACEKEIEDTHVFCPHCGTKLRE